MTTRALFRDDAYLTHCEATITAIDEQGIHLDQTVFYPLGGGQAGDAGALTLADGTRIEIADTRKAKFEGATPDDAVHVPAPGRKRCWRVSRAGDTRHGGDRLGAPLPAHAPAHGESSDVRGAALCGRRLQHHQRLRAPRFRDGRADRARAGRRAACGTGRRRARRRHGMDHRRADGRASRTRAHDEREAADGARPRASACVSKASICSRAAARMCATRARSARCAWPSSRRRARARAGWCSSSHERVVGGSSGSRSAYDADADYAALDEHARAVLDCWFGAPGSATFGQDRKLWFARDAAFDAMLRERFGALLDAAGQGALDALGAIHRSERWRW